MTNPATGAARAPARKPNGKASSYTPRKTFQLEVKSDDTEEISRAYAKHFTGGAFAALRVITAADKSAGYEGDIDVPGLMATLREQGEAVNAGNLAQAEAMLMNQATALQTLFARLAERGMGCTEVAPFETNMHANRAAGAVSMSGNDRDACCTKESTGGHRQAGKRHDRAAAGEQRRGYSTLAPAGKRNHAKQTFGGSGWRTAGHPNDEHGKQI